MKKILIGSMIGVALLTACASHDGRQAARNSVVRFVPLGGLAGNSYGLAYQTCRDDGLTTLAHDVGAASVQPQVAADAYANATFSSKARQFATRGCLDALAGRVATPPMNAIGSKP
jgi:hypothetical protein